MFTHKTQRSVVRLTLATVSLILLPTVGCSPTGAGDTPEPLQQRTLPKQGPEQDYVPGELLIRFRSPGVGKAAAAVGATSVKTFGRIGVRHWRLGKGVTVETAMKILGKAPHRDAIDFVEPNYIVQKHQAPNDPRRVDLYGMHNFGQAGGTWDADIDMLRAWGIRNDASSIVVADIDSGVDYNHEDLAANLWINDGEDLNHNGVVDASDFNNVDDDNNGFVDDIRGWNFVSDNNDPLDDNDHGTHTSGTIGAVGNNGKGVVGVCWKVKIMPLKFLNVIGRGSTSDAIDAILYAASFNVPITSNSWGGGRRSKSLERAIEESGALFVASAGNSGSSSVQYPAGYSIDNILSVAATDRNDQLASFSNFSSSWVDLAAPGVDVLSCVPGNQYAAFSGTSMAAPHCAGAAALILAQSPGMSPVQLKQTLMGSVDQIPSLSGKTVTGGRLNVFRALGGSPGNPYDPLTDTTAPASVSDLSAGSATSGSVTLTFTASADDGSTAASGPAYFYDIRYLAGQPVTASNWDSAAQVQAEPVPENPGAPETVTVTGLQPNTLHYFAVRVGDEEGNTSLISNSAWATTGSLPSGSWFIQTVESYGLVGLFPSIALDSSDNPHLAYWDEDNRDARHARWTGSTWARESIPDPLNSNTGSQTSIALDASGNPHVVYRDWAYESLTYAKKTVSGWTTEIVTSGGMDNSLAIDNNGFPCVVHNPNGTGLMYTRWNGSQWTTETVDANGGDGSLALSGGNPCISYIWIGTESGGGGNGKGKGGNKSKEVSALRYARWTGSTWQIETVDSTGGATGGNSSLALDSSGNPHITYYDAGNGDLMYARWTGSAWQIQAVDTQGDVGGHTSLAFDGAGNPHIAYNDFTNNTLKYARWTGSAWDIETVDTNLNVVWFFKSTSLAVDSLGIPHIAYVDNNSDLSDYKLKYARKVP